MIQISSLSRKYGDFKAVDQVSFEIKQGEVVGLLGHNGAGKTTIMKMITGYLEPTSGEIRVDDLQVGRDTRAIQARIGYLPENCPVWPEMTVVEYLEKATAPIQTLSRGYRQRVGVAQAILHKPDIIILDEPTNGLDPTQIFQMRELIRELAKTATVIISTHILQEVQAVCERVLIMRQGKLVVDSRIEDLQTGRQLRVTVNNDRAADYLSSVAGVSAVHKVETVDELSSYLLDAKGDSAPEVVAAIADAGDKLYRLHPETRNLETVFAEVNRGEASVTPNQS